jgi:hypothetical protein
MVGRAEELCDVVCPAFSGERRWLCRRRGSARGRPGRAHEVSRRADSPLVGRDDGQRAARRNGGGVRDHRAVEADAAADRRHACVGDVLTGLSVREVMRSPGLVRKGRRSACSAGPPSARGRGARRRRQHVHGRGRNRGRREPAFGQETSSPPEAQSVAPWTSRIAIDTAAVRSPCFSQASPRARERGPPNTVTEIGMQTGSLLVAAKPSRMTSMRRRLPNGDRIEPPPSRSWCIT